MYRKIELMTRSEVHLCMLYIERLLMQYSFPFQIIGHYSFFRFTHTHTHNICIVLVRNNIYEPRELNDLQFERRVIYKLAGLDK
jgi:hypothetical protein